MRLAAVVFFVLVSSCGKSESPALGGDPEQGRLLLRQFACGSCHSIPGVANAGGKVGPPLEHIAKRVYLAGVLPNTPENMARFILDPAQFAPRTAMPDMHVTEPHVRDMVAYLYTLK